MALWGGDVTVADDGDVHARIVLDFTNQCPVRFTRIHLGAGAAVNGKGGNAAVLQLFCQIYDNLAAGIPAETGFYGHGYLYGICHGTGYLQHLGDILQHSRTGSFAGHTFYGAAEIDVQYVRTRLLHDTRRLYHSVRILAVYLYGYGALFVTDVQLLFGLADRAYQRVARHKLGVHHIRSETFAHQSESGVGHIFHGGKQYGVLAEVYIFNLHNLTGFACKSTEKACFIRYAGVKSLKEYTASSLNLYICTIHSLNNRNNYEKEFAFSRIVRDDTAHRHFPVSAQGQNKEYQETLHKMLLLSGGLATVDTMVPQIIGMMKQQSPLYRRPRGTQ